MKTKKYLLGLILILPLILAAPGCATKKASPERYLTFEEQLKTPNDILEKQAAFRYDKFYYAQGRQYTWAPIYYPLALPDELEYESSSREFADFEGHIGQIVVNYKRGIDTLSVYEGYGKFDESKVVFEEREDLSDTPINVMDPKLVVNEGKVNAYYQERASGFSYLVFGGGTEGFANDEPVYMLKAKGLTKNEMVNIAKKMVLYQ